MLYSYEFFTHVKMHGDFFNRYQNSKNASESDSSIRKQFSLRNLHKLCSVFQQKAYEYQIQMTNISMASQPVHSVEEEGPNRSSSDPSNEGSDPKGFIMFVSIDFFSYLMQLNWRWRNG